jgi:hypothetical protein
MLAAFLAAQAWRLRGENDIQLCRIFLLAQMPRELYVRVFLQNFESTVQTFSKFLPPVSTGEVGFEKVTIV